jgi:hypothetical protein
MARRATATRLKNRRFMTSRSASLSFSIPPSLGGLEVTISRGDVADVPGAIHAEELSEDSTNNINGPEHSVGDRWLAAREVWNGKCSWTDVDLGEHRGLLPTINTRYKKRRLGQGVRGPARLEPYWSRYSVVWSRKSGTPTMTQRKKSPGKLLQNRVLISAEFF